MKIKVRKWLTKPCKFHNELNGGKVVPFRTMFGEIIEEKGRLIYVKVQGGAEPSSECLHCGRKITHPVSLLYGIGPVCGQHYHISPVSEEELENYMDEIRQKLASVKWEGWLPKNHIEMMEEKFYELIFKYQGKTYRVKTKDEGKVQKIKEKAEWYEENLLYV